MVGKALAWARILIRELVEGHGKEDGNDDGLPAGDVKVVGVKVRVSVRGEAELE